jgi:hypothetical protein
LLPTDPDSQFVGAIPWSVEPPALLPRRLRLQRGLRRQLRLQLTKANRFLPEETVLI